MRPRNSRFVSIYDQFSFFIIRHIPNPLSSGFEYQLHHTSHRSQLVPTTESVHLLSSAWNVPHPLLLSLG